MSLKSKTGLLWTFMVCEMLLSWLRDTIRALQVYSPAWDTLSGLNSRVEVVILPLVSVSPSMIPSPLDTVSPAGPTHTTWGASVMSSSSTTVHVSEYISPAVVSPVALTTIDRAVGKHWLIEGPFPDLVYKLSLVLRHVSTYVEVQWQMKPQYLLWSCGCWSLQPDSSM